MNLHLRHDRSRLSIQSRFMIYFGLVLIGIMLLVMFVAGHRQQNSAMGQIEKRGIVAAQSLASVASQALLNYDYPSLQRLAEEVRAQTGANYVIIHDKEGAVAGLSGRADLQGEKLEDIVSQRVVGASDIVVQRHASGVGPVPSADNADVLEVAMPVRVSGSDTSWGTVRVGFSLAEMRHELTGTLRDLTLLGLFAVAVVLFSARYLTSRITGPLRELAEATALVASGQLDHRLKEDLVGELGDTARSFNKMTADLRRSRDAIRYQNQHLENMVQERTAALRQKARELEKANAELKEVDRLKSDFLSNVSHELRTPLTSIRSFTEILREQDATLDKAEREEFLDIISNQSDRLTRLIGDLLDLSKIESGEFSCNIEPLPLDSLVIGPCMETLRRLAEEQDVLLEAEMPKPLPPVLGDADRLSQVLTNLVDNALKFTPAGGTVRVRAFVSDSRVPAESIEHGFHGLESDTPENGRYVVVEVSDCGIGIADEHLKIIFEKFGQVGEVLTSKPQGTGLGLAISGNIITQLGGALWVQSEVGKGSRFFFSVPVSREMERLTRDPMAGHDPRIDAMMEEVADSLNEVALGQRVLVVDDDESTTQRIIETLEPLGFRAIGCYGGSEAVRRARELRPDAIVLAALMPDISGYDVLRMLKSEPETADTPVVILGPAAEARMAYDLGAARHVAKDQPRMTATAVVQPSA